MVLNFGGVEKFQISDFKNFGFVHMISNGLSDYKAFVRRVDSKHMATRVPGLSNGTGSKPVRATGYGKSGRI